MRRPETSDLQSNLRYWRAQHKQGWGLTWYFATELCDRFYASHGIRPTVICHEGLGYYGIALELLPCHGKDLTPLGRLTMHGDVENWHTGGPGDHGLNLIDRFAASEPPDMMLGEVIRFLDLPSYPAPIHSHCRHKRWGTSYSLLFRLSALMALRWNDRVTIWNDPVCMDRGGVALDPKAQLAEHPGYFLFRSSGLDLLVAGDGRDLSSCDQASIWGRYMEGESISHLMRWLETRLGFTP